METAEITVDSTDKADAVSMSPPALCSVRALAEKWLDRADKALNTWAMTPMDKRNPADWEGAAVLRICANELLEVIGPNADLDGRRERNV